MVTNVRSFNGTSDQIGLSQGALGFSFGPGSIACIARLNGLQTHCPISAGQGANYTLAVSGSGGINLNINATWDGGAADPTLDRWYFYAITKATGTVEPRFHVYDYATATWV